MSELAAEFHAEKLHVASDAQGTRVTHHYVPHPELDDDGLSVEYDVRRSGVAFNLTDEKGEILQSGWMPLDDVFGHMTS